MAIKDYLNVFSGLVLNDVKSDHCYYLLFLVGNVTDSQRTGYVGNCESG